MGKLPLLPTNFFQNQKKKFLEQLSLYMPCRVSKSMPIHKYHVVLSQELKMAKLIHKRRRFPIF